MPLHLFSFSSPRYATVALHDSDSESDMDEQQQQQHNAQQNAKDATGAGGSTQSLVRRGSSASQNESPLTPSRGSSPSPITTRKSSRRRSAVGHCQRYWVRYLASVTLLSIIAVVVIPFIVRPWAMSAGSAPLENASVKAVPDNQPLWPIPKSFSFGNDSIVLSDDFAMEINPPTTPTPLLDKAITRYIQVLRSKQNSASRPTPVSWTPPKFPPPPIDGEQHPILAKLAIVVKDPHAALAYGMDESYTLTISADILADNAGSGDATIASAATATLTANTQWGVLRGLDTFVQLVHPTDPPSADAQHPRDTSGLLPTLGIANVPWLIQDGPRFSHRGLLLDTSRNYYPVKDILRTLDAMVVVKLNVFHWHVLDQQYYPLVSKAFPQLTQRGAEAWDRVYTPEDVAKIIQYGEERGIRVLPEFDTPGHTASWGRAFPNITVCVDAQPHRIYAAEPPAGQLDPLEPMTYKVLDTLIGEWAIQFPEEQAHAGGDEVNFNCWKTNDRIRDYINYPDRRKEYENQALQLLHEEQPQWAAELEAKPSSDTKSKEGHGLFGLGGVSGEDQLLNYFLGRLFKMYEARGKTPIVWEEMAIEHDVKLPKNAIVQVWKSAANAKKVIDKGHSVVLSSGEFWYLDCGHGNWLIGGEGQSWCPYASWQRMYSYNLTEGISSDQLKQVYGGEVCMWSEQTDANNLDSTVWPRSAAPAEILWSGSLDTEGQARPLMHAAKRLPAVRQRLIDLGVAAAPIFPSFCAKHPEGCLV